MIGETIKGIYKIYEVVSKGPLINVFMGRNLQTNEIVAVKTISKQIFDEVLGITRAEWNRRFRHEIDGLGRITAPQIARVYDYGERDDLIFVVSEYVPGKSLKQTIEERGPLGVDEALEIARQVAIGLQAAQAEKLSHGDLRPANVMITAGGGAKILDFGLSKSFIIEGLMPRAIVEMPHYVAPEQGEGETPDVRSDIYALGVMLYEMLTGELPFTSEDPTRLILKHINEPAPSVRALRPEVPAAVEEIVGRCLAKRPADRFQTPNDLIRAIALLTMAAVPTPPPEVAKAPEEVAAEVAVPPPVVPPPLEPAPAAPPPPPAPEVAPAPPVEAAPAPPVVPLPTPTPIAAPAAPAEKRKRPSPILLGAGGVAVLVLIGLVISSLLGGGEKKVGPGVTGEPTITVTAVLPTDTAVPPAAAPAATTAAPPTATATLAAPTATPMPSLTPTPFRLYLPLAPKGK